MGVTKKSLEDDLEEHTSKPSFPWHVKTVEECLAELKCSHTNFEKVGLTTANAKQRLDEYGPNKLSERKKVTLWQRIWHQVANVLVGVLVFVAVVSAVRAATADESTTIVTNWIQVALILSVITLNTIIGIVQEGSAEKAADALQAMLSSDAIVVRDQKEIKIAACELVPGDIVKLFTGERVPADLRVLQSNNLASLEAALTGEALPIFKNPDPIKIPEGVDPNQQPLGDRHNMCFSATLITQGSGLGVVVATGDHTEIGTINALVNKVESKKTNVLKQIDTVSKLIAILILIASGGTWLVAYFITGMEPLDALTTALVCAVAMIPEGLEAIVTVTYAWAVSNMAKKNAIIRALPAVETLGSVTVICSDKTGTLTKNEMSLVVFVTSQNRLKFDVHATERSTTNFTFDNSFISDRADHTKMLSRGQVIRQGPSVSRHGKRRKALSFPFGMSSSFRTTHSAIDMSGDNKNPDEKREVAIATVQNKDTGTSSGSVVSPDTAFLRRLFSGGILCSKCVLGESGGREGEIGNPTELSILRAAYFGNVNVSEVKDSAPIVAEVPFSSEYKFMATVHAPNFENDGIDGSNCDDWIVHVKGAPDRLISVCQYQAKNGDVLDVEPLDPEYWIDQIAILSSHGLRVLALARGTIPKDSLRVGDSLGPELVMGRPGENRWLTLVGLCAIMDPPRPECIGAVQEAHSAGVRVAMITGDHPDTALAIATTLGIADGDHPEVITGPELDNMMNNDQELEKAVMKYNVFARASPQNKIVIVKALQAVGQICGMTGDGVNDAPALRAADMGVAMGKEGTDVAREASDMILADDNFATIIAAIQEGRVVWDNLRKVLLVNTPINNAQGLSVLFGLLFGLDESPLSSIQVLFANLVSACTLGFVCAVEPAEDGIMDQPPRRVGKRLIGRYLCLRIVLGTIILVVGVVGSVFWSRSQGYDEYEDRAQALNVLNFGAIAITMSARFARKSAFHSRSWHGNPLALWSYGIILCIQVFITYTPGVNKTLFSQTGMDAWQWGVVALGAVMVFIVMEVEKSIRNILADWHYDVDDLEYGPWDDPPSILQK